jgi:hypothetical protein
VQRFVEGQDRAQFMVLPECLDNFVREYNPVGVALVADAAVQPCANHSGSRRGACPVYLSARARRGSFGSLPKLAFKSGRNSILARIYFFDRAGDYVALVGVIQVNLAASEYDCAKKVGRASVRKG